MKLNLSSGNKIEFTNVTWSEMVNLGKDPCPVLLKGRQTDDQVTGVNNTAAKLQNRRRQKE